MNPSTQEQPIGQSKFLEQLSELIGSGGEGGEGGNGGNGGNGGVFGISSHQEIYGDSYPPIPQNPNIGSNMMGLGLGGNRNTMLLILGAIILGVIYYRSKR